MHTQSAERQAGFAMLALVVVLVPMLFLVGSYLCLTMVYKSAGTEVDGFLRATPPPAMPPAN